MKTTVVIGASPDPSRTSYQAVQRMSGLGMQVTAIGLREGEIDGVKIQTGKPVISEVDTVSLYVGPKNQPGWYDYIISLKPERLILNPGAENPELEKLAEANGIEVISACTLVMLSVGTF